MITAHMLTGLVLAGGCASRMQAGVSKQEDAAAVDKGLLALHGEPLVAHAHRVLAPHVQSMLISANRNELAYAAYGQVIADDAALGRELGPLAGVERALVVAGTPWVAVLPVDVVKLPPDLVPRLLAAVCAHDAPMAYACSAERAHPLCMVLRSSLAGSLRRYLQAGDRKVQLWQGRHQAVPVLFEGDEIFLNINTPLDLRYASQCWKS